MNNLRVLIYITAIYTAGWLEHDGEIDSEATRLRFLKLNLNCLTKSSQGATFLHMYLGMSYEELDLLAIPYGDGPTPGYIETNGFRKVLAKLTPSWLEQGEKTIPY